MTRDEFEFLLSQWLDEPTRADLSAAVAAAVAAEPEFAGVRDEWVRFDRVSRPLIPGAPQVEWTRQAEHIRAHLAAAAHEVEQADRRLDSLLGALPQPPIAWERLRGRITAAARGTERSGWSYRAAWAAVVTAAAAIVAFILLRPSLPGVSQPGPVMVAQAVVQLSAPVAFPSAAQVQVTVGRADGALQPPTRPAAESEFFLMVDPAPSRSAEQVSVVPGNGPRVASVENPGGRQAVLPD